MDISCTDTEVVVRNDEDTILVVFDRVTGDCIFTDDCDPEEILNIVAACLAMIATDTNGHSIKLTDNPVSLPIFLN